MPEQPKERAVKEYLVRRIVIDVVLNDPVDFKAGGPRFQGFDFSISADEKKGKAARLMQEILNKYGVPHVALHIDGNTSYAKKVWTWEEIEACVKKDGPPMTRWRG